MAPAVPELDVLHARDPSLDDTDDWEEFTISKAIVHQPGNENELVSLLVAEAGFPVTVTGELEPLDPSDHNLYVHGANRSARPINILIEDVRQFAFGQEDDSSAIWAAGKSGWHRLQPARKYKKIYDEMCEAVSVLYFIVDAYKTERYEGKGKNRTLLKDYSAQELFAKYAHDVLNTDDVDEAAERIYRHKDFLISSMLAGREGLAWSKNPLTKHLWRKFPEEVIMLKRRQEALSDHEVSAAKSRRTRAQSAETSSTATSKPTRTRSSRQPSIAPQTEAAARSDDVRIRRTRQGSVETSSTTGSRNTKRGRAARAGKAEVISLDGTSDADDVIPEQPEEEDTKEGREPAAVMGPPKTRPLPLRRTRHNATHQNDRTLELLATPAKDDESDEEIRVREQKNKSSLRPRASKGSKSTTRNGGKVPREHVEDAEDGPDPPSSPMPSKRKHVDERDEVGRRKLKRRNSRPHDDEGIDIPTSPDSSGADVELPLRLSEVAHMEDPVQEDTWLCALDGCTHKVYASSHPDSQRLIREHYALHAYDDDERVQMVKKIEAPSLPVGRLMEKVKMRAKADGFPNSIASAPSMPENVRSRFGIAGQVGVLQRY